MALRLKQQLELAIDNGVPLGPPDPDKGKLEVPAGLLREVILGRPELASSPGRLWLQDAVISGVLMLEACHVKARLRFDRCVFEGSIDLAQINAVDIQLIGCTVKGRLIADQLEVRWNLSLEGTTVEEGIGMIGATVGGRLSLVGATVNAPDEGQGGIPAFSGSGLSVAGSAFFQELEADGEVRLLGAKIVGQLSLNGATLGGGEEGDDSPSAFNADYIEISAGMYCLNGFKATGEVRLLGARIGGQLSMDGCRIDGKLSMVAATIDTELGLVGATLTGGDGPALMADRIEVGGGLFCRGLTATGELRLLGARIGGQFSLDGATLKARDDQPDDRFALNASNIEIGRGVYCRRGFSVSGGMGLPGAKIGGQLSIMEAELLHDDGKALWLSGASIDELLFMPTAVSGEIDLRRASVRSLWDVHEGEIVGPGEAELRLEGFTYQSLGAPLDAKRRLAWIEPTDGARYFPGIYVELSEAFRRIGHRGDARKVAIRGERRAIEQLKPWRPRWLWNKLLWITTGSGYRNWLALLWLLGVLALGSLLFWHCESDFTPLIEDPPSFNPVLYAVDATVPVLDVGQQRIWAATGWLRWVSLFLTIAGYALVTAVVAAGAGLLNRDQRS